MVVFVDLEEDGDLDLHGRDSHGTGVDGLLNPFHGPKAVMANGGAGQAQAQVQAQAPAQPAATAVANDFKENERENPNLNGFSAALSCYP